MYDDIAKSYAKGEIDKTTFLEILWTMGASFTERVFILEAAEKMKKSNEQRNPRTTEET